MSHIDQVLDPYAKVLFSGTPESVHKWLTERSLFREGIKVHVGQTMKILGVHEYLDNEPLKSGGKLYTEDEVVAIVQREIRKVLGLVAERAKINQDSFSMDDPSYASYDAINVAFEGVLGHVNHSEDCTESKPSKTPTKCTCNTVNL